MIDFCDVPKYLLGVTIIARYDYEKIEKEPAEKVIKELREMISKGSLVGQKYDQFVVKMADDYKYVDTIDKSVSEKQVSSTALYLN